jgi:predicted Rossmann-fold nucleotide-binding protein
VQTQKVTSFPIVLLGSDYWGGLIDWIKQTVLAEGKISDGDLDMFRVTDDVHEAVQVMVDAQRQRHSSAPGAGEKHENPKRPD